MISKERRRQVEHEAVRTNQEESQRLMEENAIRQMEGERRYRQFFAECDKKMCERMKRYADYVVSPDGARTCKPELEQQTKELSGRVRGLPQELCRVREMCMR